MFDAHVGAGEPRRGTPEAICRVEPHGPLRDGIRQHRPSSFQMPNLRQGRPAEPSPRQHLSNPLHERPPQIVIPRPAHPIGQCRQHVRQVRRRTAVLEPRQGRHQVAARRIVLPPSSLVKQEVPAASARASCAETLHGLLRSPAATGGGGSRAGSMQADSRPGLDGPRSWNAHDVDPPPGPRLGSPSAKGNIRHSSMPIRRSMGALRLRPTCSAISRSPHRAFTGWCSAWSVADSCAAPRGVPEVSKCS